MDRAKNTNPFTHHEAIAAVWKGEKKCPRVMLWEETLSQLSLVAKCSRLSPYTPISARCLCCCGRYRTVHAGGRSLLHNNMQTSVKKQTNKRLWFTSRTACAKPCRDDNTVLPLSSPLQEQAATGYREQDYTLNMRDPPKAPPLKSSMSERQEVGLGRWPGAQII